MADWIPIARPGEIEERGCKIVDIDAADAAANTTAAESARDRHADTSRDEHHEPTGRHLSAEARLRAAAALLVPGAVGVVAGGLVAAADAHAPTSAVVWAAAYLVVVVGAAQIALATGQALLAEPAVSRALIRCQAVLFNLGSAAVIGGTLGDSFVFVALGTVMVLGTLAAFMFTAWHGRTGYSLWLHQGLISIVALGAIIGLILSGLGSNP